VNIFRHAISTGGNKQSVETKLIFTIPLWFLQ